MAESVLVNRKRKGFGIKNETCAILEKYSQETGIPESRVIDKALDEYFENHNIK